MNPCDSFFFPKHLIVSVKVRDGDLSSFGGEFNSPFGRRV